MEQSILEQSILEQSIFSGYGSSRFQQIQNAIDQPSFLQDDSLLQVRSNKLAPFRSVIKAININKTRQRLYFQDIGNENFLDSLLSYVNQVPMLKTVLGYIIC